MPVHRPHEKPGIDVLYPKPVLRPTLAPDTELTDDRLQLPSRIGQTVFHALQLGSGAGPLDDPCVHQLVQALGERRWGDERDGPAQVGEVATSRQQFPDHDWHPALGQELGRPRDRTELAVTRSRHTPEDT